MQITKKIIVTGKVQGVWYRQSAKSMAGELDIKGTVQNLADGSVNIIASGREDQLLKLIEWCKEGPPRAHVLSVDVTDLNYQHFEKFSIL